MSERAVITLALGPVMYRNMAVNLLRSIRQWHPPGDLSVTLVTDSASPLPPDLQDVSLMVLKRDELGIGFETKLHLDRLAPAPCTLFIDADCLLYEPLDRLFARLAGRPVATVGGIISEGEWFGDVGALCRQLGVPAIPKFNGGLYYIERGGTCSAVYQQARDLAGRYDELGLVRLRGRPNDELIMASAMALAGLTTVPDDGSFMSDPQACPGPMNLNILTGLRQLHNPPAPSQLHRAWYPFATVSPAIVHFLGEHAQLYPYRAEATRLSLHARGWPKPLANAWATATVQFPGWLGAFAKKTLRPLYRKIAGVRAIAPSPRIS
jgi:hypothetical protein